jgi:iron complex transport system substrate-binding protein
VRATRAITLAAALLAGAAAGAGEAPARVVSINLCTDQLAMLLAAPGQLVSVSYLARDPRSSAMARAAAAVPINRSRAEEIYLLKPDLVLGGTFSTPGTVSMLRRLGVRVELLPPADSLAETARQIREVGHLLGQGEKAEAMAWDFEARLAAFPPPPANPPRLALYGANGATSRGGLAHEIVTRAGFANIAADLTLPETGRLALERLILADPDVIVTQRRFPGTSQAEAILDHPALRTLTVRRAAGALTDADWVCGLPQSLDALERMVDLRLSLEAGG